MTQLYLIRHGEVDAEGRFYGHLDLPLAKAGVGQLERAADALSHLKLAAVHCSDLERAAHSARLIARPHELEPQGDPAFREMNLGVLEGLPHAEAAEQHPELATKRYSDMWTFRFPGGENLADIAARTRPALHALLERHAGQILALVAHNSVNRVILGDALGLPLERVFDFAQDFGCINIIDYTKRPRVELLNWTPDSLTPTT
jgi:alpha-ribazole phosphatase